MKKTILIALIAIALTGISCKEKGHYEMKKVSLNYVSTYMQKGNTVAINRWNSSNLVFFENVDNVIYDKAVNTITVYYYDWIY